GEGVHHAGQGRALLAELEEDLAELAVVVSTGRHVALGATDGEARGPRDPGLRQALAERLGHLDDLDLLGDLLALVLLGLVRLAVRARLPDLAVVAVDGRRLPA